MGNSSADQFGTDGGQGVACPGGVNQNAHMDAPGDRAAKSLDKGKSGGVIVKNIGTEGYGGLSRLDGCQHGWEGLVAIDQWLDGISRGKRRGCDPADDSGQQAQVFRAHRFGFTHVFGHQAVKVAMNGQFYGTPAHAINAKDQIEGRAEQGHEPGNADPKCGCAMIPLVEEGVSGDEQGGQEIKPGRNMGPESG